MRPFMQKSMRPSMQKYVRPFRPHDSNPTKPTVSEFPIFPISLFVTTLMLSDSLGPCYFEVFQALPYSLGTIRQLHGQFQGCREKGDSEWLTSCKPCSRVTGCRRREDSNCRTQRGGGRLSTGTRGGAGDPKPSPFPLTLPEAGLSLPQCGRDQHTEPRQRRSRLDAVPLGSGGRPAAATILLADRPPVIGGTGCTAALLFLCAARGLPSAANSAMPEAARPSCCFCRCCCSAWEHAITLNRGLQLKGAVHAVGRGCKNRGCSSSGSGCKIRVQHTSIRFQYNMVLCRM